MLGIVAVFTATTLPAESSASSPPPLTSSPSPSPFSSSPSRPAAALDPARRRTLIVELPRDGGNGGDAPRIECASDILRFGTVEDAVAAAAEGDVVALVAGGGGSDGEGEALVIHSGRAVLSKPGITLTTLGFDFDDDDDDGGDEGEEGAVRASASTSSSPSPPSSSSPKNKNSRNKKRATLSHETSRPYESTVAVSAPGCRVVGLTIRHSSPSVANNYAVHVEESASAPPSSAEAGAGSPPTTILGCDVASSSGSALGLDAAARVSRCRLASSSRFGAAVFAPGPPRTRLYRCELSGGGGKGSKGDVKGGSGGGGGLLVRGGDVEVRECSLSGDPFAMRLVDGTGVVSGCAVEKGRVEEGVAWEGEVVV